METTTADVAPRPRLVGEYWDDVAERWRRARPQPLWRAFSDLHQASLFARWSRVPTPEPGSPRGAFALLKTDLFDEVAGRGVVCHLQAYGARVTGVDISPVIVAEATACNPGLEAVVADVRTLPFDAAAFDVVFSGSTLDHFESTADIETALAELHRVLRPGGRLILTMDNAANPLIRLRNGPLLGLLRRIGVVPYQVGVTLGPRALAAAVREAGFDVVETTAVMHCPRVIAVGLAGLLVERLPQACRDAFLGCLAACERLESLPTRWLTGHYVAICAVARTGGIGRTCPSAQGTGA